MCATIAAIAVQMIRTQIATAIAAVISDIVSSFPFMPSSSEPDSGHHQRRIAAAWTRNLRVRLRRTARNFHSSNVHAVVNPRRRQPTSRYSLVHRRRANVVVRDNDARRRRRLNTNDRIVSDALADGVADMPNLVATAARRGSDRGCDSRSDYA